MSHGTPTGTYISNFKRKMSTSGEGGKNPPETFGGDDPKSQNEWPGTEDVLSRPSWAQILGAQVADEEVKRFEEELVLKVPGEGAKAKITGSDCIMKERYLNELTEMVKCNNV